MTDADEIRNLIASFCFAVDAKDAASWDTLFTDDAALLYKEDVMAAGREVLGPWLQARTLGGSHLTLNTYVVVEGDSASSLANYLVLGADLAIGGAGYYQCEFRRTPAGWKIAKWRVLDRDAAVSP